MAFYRNRVYPRLVSVLGNPEPIQDIRRRILARAEGRVLEIGAGPGVNFDYYDPARVEKVFALEPNPGMLKLADAKWRGTQLEVEFLGLRGERIPLADGSVDTVVSTFTLCTIPGVVEAIRGIGRVLKPDWVFEGCHLTRDIPSLIHQGGFEIGEIHAEYLARFPKIASYCWWGFAVPEKTENG